MLFVAKHRPSAATPAFPMLLPAMSRNVKLGWWASASASSCVPRGPIMFHRSTSDAIVWLARRLFASVIASDTPMALFSKLLTHESLLSGRIKHTLPVRAGVKTREDCTGERT